MDFVGHDTRPLGDDDLAYAAQTLGCDVAAIKAVSAVEAPHGGFIADGRPTILFESHAFYTSTQGRFGELAGISSPRWVHDYGPGGGHQYDRLARAMEMDEEAALKSCSWGKYQIMGSNFAAAGYDTVDAFVADMCESEGYQLDAFVTFILNSTVMCDALRAHDWITFARRYNGPGQVEYYAQRIAEAYCAQRIVEAYQNV